MYRESWLRFLWIFMSFAIHERSLGSSSANIERAEDRHLNAEDAMLRSLTNESSGSKLDTFKCLDDGLVQMDVLRSSPVHSATVTGRPSAATLRDDGLPKGRPAGPGK